MSRYPASWEAEDYDGEEQEDVVDQEGEPYAAPVNFGAGSAVEETVVIYAPPDRLRRVLAEADAAQIAGEHETALQRLQLAYALAKLIVDLAGPGILERPGAASSAEAALPQCQLAAVQRRLSDGYLRLDMMPQALAHGRSALQRADGLWMAAAADARAHGEAVSSDLAAEMRAVLVSVRANLGTVLLRATPPKPAEAERHVMRALALVESLRGPGCAESIPLLLLASDAHVVLAGQLGGPDAGGGSGYGAGGGVSGGRSSLGLVIESRPASAGRTRPGLAPPAPSPVEAHRRPKSAHGALRPAGGDDDRPRVVGGASAAPPPATTAAGAYARAESLLADAWSVGDTLRWAMDDPRHAPTYERLLSLHRARRQWPEANDYCSKLLRTADTAFKLMQEGGSGVGAAAAREVRRLVAMRVDIASELAQLRVKVGDPAGAAQLLAFVVDELELRAGETAPPTLAALKQKGMAEAKAGSLHAALETFTRSLAAHVAAHGATSVAAAEAHKLLGSVRLALCEDEAAPDARQSGLKDAWRDYATAHHLLRQHFGPRHPQVSELAVRLHQLQAFYKEAAEGARYAADEASAGISGGAQVDDGGFTAIGGNLVRRTVVSS